MNERFEQIYAKNERGHGSGEGSLPGHHRGYVQFLGDFLVRPRWRKKVLLVESGRAS